MKAELTGRYLHKRNWLGEMVLWVEVKSNETYFRKATEVDLLELEKGSNTIEFR